MFLEMENIYLDKGKPEDWRDIYNNLWKWEESARYMLWRVTTNEEDAKARMERTVRFQRENDVWFIYEKSEGQAIGFAGIEEVEPGVYEDTGIAFGPKYVGRGYGKQLLQALLRYCFEELDAKKFIYTCRKQNEASRRLALSCGFVYVGAKECIDPRDNQPYILEKYERRREY